MLFMALPAAFVKPPSNGATLLFLDYYGFYKISTIDRASVLVKVPLF
jgi:hypothetical protein